MQTGPIRTNRELATSLRDRIRGRSPQRVRDVVRLGDRRDRADVRPASVDAEIPISKHYLFYATYLLCLTGLLGICITGDLFNVFVFLEISSLSSYALISLGKHRRARLAALQYLILGTIGATFILIGIGLVYQMTGTLNMADIAARLNDRRGPRTMLVAFAFMTIGLCIKMAVFPFTRGYPMLTRTPHRLSPAFIAATATKVSVYAFIRLVFGIFTPQFAFERLPLDTRIDDVLSGWNLCRIDGGHLPRQRQTVVGLFQCRTDRIHVAGDQYGQRDGLDRRNRSHVQSRHDQRRAVYGRRLLRAAIRISPDRRLAGCRTNDALDFVRLGDGRTGIDRGAADRRIRQQMAVADCGLEADVGRWRHDVAQFFAGRGLRLASC